MANLVQVYESRTYVFMTSLTLCLSSDPILRGFSGRWPRKPRGNPFPPGGGEGVGKTVVIGYGNPLRGDDGIGWAVIERLQQMPLAETLTLIASHQLLPELSDLIREAAQVIIRGCHRVG